MPSNPLPSAELERIRERVRPVCCDCQERATHTARGEVYCFAHAPLDVALDICLTASKRDADALLSEVDRLRAALRLVNELFIDVGLNSRCKATREPCGVDVEETFTCGCEACSEWTEAYRALLPVLTGLEDK